MSQFIAAASVAQRLRHGTWTRPRQCDRCRRADPASDAEGPQERATLSFEHANHDDIIAIVERMLRNSGFAPDAAPAVAVGVKLLSEVMLRERRTARVHRHAQEPAARERGRTERRTQPTDPKATKRAKAGLKRG